MSSETHARELLQKLCWAAEKHRASASIIFVDIVSYALFGPRISQGTNNILKKLGECELECYMIYFMDLINKTH